HQCHLFSATVPHHTVLYPLSLHDALPISVMPTTPLAPSRPPAPAKPSSAWSRPTMYRLAWSMRALRWQMQQNMWWPKSCPPSARSEEHTSELQSRENLVCRLLLEKKNTTT